jgi:hypothetical protein
MLGMSFHNYPINWCEGRRYLSSSASPSLFLESETLSWWLKDTISPDKVAAKRFPVFILRSEASSERDETSDGRL